MPCSSEHSRDTSQHNLALYRSRSSSCQRILRERIPAISESIGHMDTSTSACASALYRHKANALLPAGLLGSISPPPSDSIVETTSSSCVTHSATSALARTAGWKFPPNSQAYARWLRNEFGPARKGIETRGQLSPPLLWYILLSLSAVLPVNPPPERYPPPPTVLCQSSRTPHQEGKNSALSG